MNLWNSISSISLGIILCSSTSHARENILLPGDVSAAVSKAIYYCTNRNPGNEIGFEGVEAKLHNSRETVSIKAVVIIDGVDNSCNYQCGKYKGRIDCR